MSKAELDTLRNLARDLKLAGEGELADKVACALSALAGTKEPKTEYSYSFILRNLRKGDKDRQRDFQVAFKESFDEAMSEGLEDAERMALMSAMKVVNFE